MIIAFEKPLTALEIREPAIEACDIVAEEVGLYVGFQQSQQRAMTGHYRQERFGSPKRTRIGNGKHKDWFINFQTEHPGSSEAIILGRITIKGPIIPEEKQFGGFEYGNYGEEKPTYSYITVAGQLASEFNHINPRDVDPTILTAAKLSIRESLLHGQNTLFDLEEYLINC